MADDFEAERQAGHARGPVGLEGIGIKNINNCVYKI